MLFTLELNHNLSLLNEKTEHAFYNSIIIIIVNTDIVYRIKVGNHLHEISFDYNQTVTT